MVVTRSRIRAAVVSAAAVLAVALSASAPASATDFCLDLSAPDCPEGAVFASNLDTALLNFGDDGVPDRVFIPAGTTSAFINFSPDDTTLTDDVSIVGAGRDSTVLTSNATTNVYVVDLSGIRNRKVTMRDLTIRVPGSFPDSGGNGSALQEVDDVFERVNIESRNAGSSAVGGLSNGGVFKDVHIFGSEGGSFTEAFLTNGFNEGDSLEIEDSVVEDVMSGVGHLFDPGLPVHIRRSRFSSESGALFSVYNANWTIENSVIEAGMYTPIQVGTLDATAEPSHLTLKNDTILGVGGAEVAINVEAGGSASGDAEAKITDSIIFGFANSWTTSAATGPAVGDANLDISYSNFENPGTAAGDGTVHAALANISQNPGFVDFTDYHLSADSPSIDAGNPVAGGLLDDFDGNVRPLDGNGDGTRVRDQGAFEAAEVPSCETDPTLCPKPPPGGDTTPPVVSKLRSKKVGKKAKVFKFTYRLSEPAKVKFTFKPTPAKKKHGKKRKTVIVTKQGKFGTNVLKLKKRQLKPGRYRVTVRPTDAAGNAGKPLAVKAIYTSGKRKRFNVQFN